MRFVVYGAGAIGATIGGRLHQSGHDVVLVARGAHATAVQRDGLRLESPDEAATLRIPTVVRPDEIDWSPDDTVILGVKSQDTAGAAAALALAAGPDVAVVAAQNGVANERTLSRWFARVYGMCVMCPASNLQPGVIQAHSAPITGMLDLGRFPTGADETATAVAAALQSSTFLSEPRADIMRWKYRKLVMNLGNGVQALCGTSDWTDELQQITAMLETEATRCFAAAGIDPVTNEEDKARRGNNLTIRSVGDRSRAGGSTWQSLRRGTGSVETDYLNGEVALLGRLHGISTHANSLVQRLTNEAARDHRPPGHMTHRGLLAELHAWQRVALDR